MRRAYAPYSRAMPDALRLGFIGLGNIGGGVAANLVADGHRLTVYDTEAARAAAVQGAAVADGPAGVAAEADITFLSLPSPAIVDTVARSWAEGARAGSVLVDLTTNSPATVRAVGARLAAQGLRFLESPVTGGAIGARSRMLVFIMGGDEAVVAEVEPLLKS